jgi:hypothetical protein
VLVCAWHECAVLGEPTALHACCCQGHGKVVYRRCFLDKMYGRIGVKTCNEDCSRLKYTARKKLRGVEGFVVTVTVILPSHSASLSRKKHP